MTHSSLSPCLINLWQVKCKWNENSTFKRDKGYKKKHLQQLCSNNHGHLVTRAVARETQSKEVVGASLPWAQHAGGASDRWPVEIAGLTKIHTDLIPQSVVYDSVTVLTDKKDNKVIIAWKFSVLSPHHLQSKPYNSMNHEVGKTVLWYLMKKMFNYPSDLVPIKSPNVQLSIYPTTALCFCLFNCMPTFPTTFSKNLVAAAVGQKHLELIVKHCTPDMALNLKRKCVCVCVYS